MSEKRELTIHYATIDDIVDKKVECPLPVEVIPNYMGINLCNVGFLSWTKQEDGQLTELKICFKPATNNDN
jgi:hypothetical protein